MKTNKKSQPVDDSLMTKEEFLAKIERSAQSVREGRCVTFYSKEEMFAYLDRL